MERYRGPEQPHSIAPRQCAVCPVQASTERTERDMQNESTPGARGPVFCGVDTHADSHWLCVLDWRGRKVLSRQFPADAAGYEALAGAIAAAGEPACVAMEGTSSYGAGLTRHLASLGMPVREALSPARMQRRRPGQGKLLASIYFSPFSPTYFRQSRQRGCAGFANADAPLSASRRPPPSRPHRRWTRPSVGMTVPLS